MPKWTTENSVKDLVGASSGLLTVTKFFGVDTRNRRAHWLCTCRCGQTRIVSSKLLNNKLVRSCGCAGAAIKAKQAKFKAERMRQMYGDVDKQAEDLTRISNYIDRKIAKRFMDNFNREAAKYRAEHSEDFADDTDTSVPEPVRSEDLTNGANVPDTAAQDTDAPIFGVKVTFSTMKD